MVDHLAGQPLMLANTGGVQRRWHPDQRADGNLNTGHLCCWRRVLGGGPGADLSTLVPAAAVDTGTFLFSGCFCSEVLRSTGATCALVAGTIRLVLILVVALWEVGGLRAGGSVDPLGQLLPAGLGLAKQTEQPEQSGCWSFYWVLVVACQGGFPSIALQARIMGTHAAQCMSNASAPEEDRLETGLHFELFTHVTRFCGKKVGLVCVSRPGSTTLHKGSHTS